MHGRKCGTTGGAELHESVCFADPKLHQSACFADRKLPCAVDTISMFAMIEPQ